ncbi:hypothetical protein ES705_26985 [subsurface metagenome]
MVENKKKTKQKAGPAKKPKEEEVIDGEVVEEPTAEEKVPEAKIVKVMPDYDQLMKYAETFGKAALFPGIENIHQAAAVIQLGQEILLPPMTSLRTIFVIPSKRGSTLCIKSEALLALAIDKGVHLEVLSKTHKGCKLRFSRKGQKDHVEEYTEEDAKRAGLLGKDNWMKHPTNMYFSRCVKNGLQSFDARLSLGLSTVEEMEDEGIVDILKPPAEEKPPEPEEEKKAQVSFTKTKDQPAAEPEKEEKPPEPPPPPGESEARDKELVVEDIKSYLDGGKVDKKLFKKWLGEELQPSKPDREFVGLKFGNWSFTEGKLDDLKLLKMNMEWAVEKFLESKIFKEEAKKDEPDEKVKKDPL